MKKFIKVFGALALILCMSLTLVGCFDPKVTAIDLNQSFQTIYQQGEQLNVDGGILSVTYSDETINDVAVTKSMVSGFTAATVGERNLIITYSGKTCTVQYTVTGAKLTENYLYYNDDSDMCIYIYKESGSYILLQYNADNSSAAAEWLSVQSQTYRDSVDGYAIPFVLSYNSADYHYYLNANSGYGNVSLKVLSLDNIVNVEVPTTNMLDGYTRYVPVA